jgi:hypothetical protein
LETETKWPIVMDFPVAKRRALLLGL